MMALKPLQQIAPDLIPLPPDADQLAMQPASQPVAAPQTPVMMPAYQPDPQRQARERQLQANLDALQAKSMAPAKGFWGKAARALTNVANAAGNNILGAQQMSLIPGTQANRIGQYEGNQAALSDLQQQDETERQQADREALENAQIQHLTRPESSQTVRWKPLLGGNGQIVTAPGGKIIEVSDTGDVRAQDLPENTTIAVKPSAASGAFAQWSQNPEKYQEFQKTMAEIKAQVAAEHPHQAANSSFMNVYAAQRFLQMAYADNPALLPVASRMIGRLLNLSPEETSTIGQVPVDQPLSPVTQQPIGTRMPSAPTGATRTSAQNAEKFLTEYPRISADVKSAASDLGPVNGRAVMGFLLGTVGTTGNESADKKLSKLRTDLTFVGSNAAKFHINSVRQAELFDKLAGQNQSTAPAIQGFLDAIKNWAQTSANQQRGYGEQPNGSSNQSGGKPDYVYVPGKGLVKQ